MDLFTALFLLACGVFALYDSSLMRYYEDRSNIRETFSFRPSTVEWVVAIICLGLSGANFYLYFSA